MFRSWDIENDLESNKERNVRLKREKKMKNAEKKKKKQEAKSRLGRAG